jgi:hypothetical protein
MPNEGQAGSYPLRDCVGPDGNGVCVSRCGHAGFGKLHGQQLDVHLLGRRSSDCWSAIAGFRGDPQTGESHCPKAVGKVTMCRQESELGSRSMTRHTASDGSMPVKE